VIEVYFGVAAVGLCAVFYLLVTARGLRGTAYDRNDANVAIFSDRRTELQAEGYMQGVTEEDMAQLDDELAMSLLDDEPAGLVSDHVAARPEPSMGVMIVRIGATILVAIAVALYPVWGEPHALILEKIPEILSRDISQENRPELERANSALITRVVAKPNDRDSWFYLGYVRLRTSDFQGAAEAFEMVHNLAGANPEVDIAWAQASYLAAGGTVTAATRRIIDRALRARFDNPEMLEMLAMDSIRQNDFGPAAGYLGRLLGQALPAHKRTLLEQALDRSRSELDPERPLIMVTVSVDHPDPPSWLLVFARPVEGGAPRAVIRRPVKATQTYVLDDVVSMGMGEPLSVGGSVEVVARLSRAGMARTGFEEIQAASQAVDPADQPHVRLSLAKGDTRVVIAKGEAVVVGSAKVIVDVSLAPNFEAAAAAPVYIIARDASSPGPPLAVRRLTVRDLPARIELTNDDAMMPGRKLSEATTLELLARVSLNGTPTASRGDLQSPIVTGRLGMEAVNLHIQRRLP
jgi:cytochrome c-type biogenesis protein CcmH